MFLRCPDGTVSNATDATSESTCQACQSGSAADRTAAQCETCTPGTYATTEAGPYGITTRATTCMPCPAGTFSENAGEIYCTDCAGKTFSAEGSTGCTQCAEFSSTFWDYNSGGCEECPEGAQCPGLSTRPVPEEGFWSDRSDILYSKYVYPCYRSTCKGGGSRERDLACWEDYGGAYNASTCLDEFQCETGSTGILCGSCKYRV